ncbi:MAG: glycosyltransferase [Chloroflexi bacterium]|nr:glycosyltransferase [Ktedonobacteraceae bacterium]MBV9020614.1 glycosyltransferase [Ktedonobacteraceae bacterium]MBV9709232.1 glycosyltransferase [Chloroflexota bacterium]
MTTNPYRHGIPQEILALSHERDLLRRRGHYERADLLKQQIEDAGYVIKDNPHGAHLVTLPSIDIDGQVYRTVRQVPSLLDTHDGCTFSVNILARNNFAAVRRCIESVLHFCAHHDIEIVLVDNASRDGIDVWAESLHYQEPRLHLLQASRIVGEAEARNIGLKRSTGCYILILDASVELTGDLFTPLAKTLANTQIGITGLRGLRTDDLRHFEESQEVEVEVIESTCMAFRRGLLKQVGLFDERYRYSHYMDIDFSFAVRDTGVQTAVTPHLPLICHPQSHDSAISDAERARLTKRNFYRFLEKWGDRDDLLLEN